MDLLEATKLIGDTEIPELAEALGVGDLGDNLENASAALITLVGALAWATGLLPSKILETIDDEGWPGAGAENN